MQPRIRGTSRLGEEGRSLLILELQPPWRLPAQPCRGLIRAADSGRKGRGSALTRCPCPRPGDSCRRAAVKRPCRTSPSRELLDDAQWIAGNLEGLFDSERIAYAVRESLRSGLLTRHGARTRPDPLWTVQSCVLRATSTSGSAGIPRLSADCLETGGSSTSRATVEEAGKSELCYRYRF